MKKNTLLILFSYLTIYIVWGTTYYFIAVAVETIPPMWIVSSRFLLGGLGLVLIPLLAKKISTLPTKQEVLTSLFLGFFLLIMGNGVVTTAEKWVDSYIASLIISTVPLVVAIMNSIIYRVKLNIYQVLGFFIGFAGVTLLLYSDSPRDVGELKGILLIFLAIFCWAFGTTWSRKLTHHKNTLFSTGMQMLFAGVIAVFVMLFENHDYQTVVSGISIDSLYAVIFLTIVGSSAIGAYNYLLKHEPSNRITSYALINPLIATLVGVFIGGEEPAKFIIPGVVLILLGLTVMLYLSQRVKPRVR